MNPLVSMLLIFFSAILPPAQTGPQPYNGRAPLVLTSPNRPTAGTPVDARILAMPKRSSHVQLVTDDGTRYAAKHVGLREYSVKGVLPPSAGPWQLNVQFELHGETYSVIGSVVTVLPAR